jgi:hypothetical protein
MGITPWLMYRRGITELATFWPFNEITRQVELGDQFAARLQSREK